MGFGLKRDTSFFWVITKEISVPVCNHRTKNLYILTSTKEVCFLFIRKPFSFSPCNPTEMDTVGPDNRQAKGCF